MRGAISCQLPPLTELSRLFAKGVRGDTFDRWLRGHGLPADPWSAAGGRLSFAHAQIKPFPEAQQLLAVLRTLIGWLRRPSPRSGSANSPRWVWLPSFAPWSIRCIGPPPGNRVLAPLKRVLQSLAVNGRQARVRGDNPPRTFAGLAAGNGYDSVASSGRLYGRLEPASEADSPISTSRVCWKFGAPWQTRTASRGAAAPSILFAQGIARHVQSPRLPLPPTCARASASCLLEAFDSNWIAPLGRTSIRWNGSSPRRLEWPKRRPCPAARPPCICH